MLVKHKIYKLSSGKYVNVTYKISNLKCRKIWVERYSIEAHLSTPGMSGAFKGSIGK